MAMDTGGSDSVISRAIRAAMLDRALYRTIGSVPEATNQAIIVVVAAAVASGIGALIGQFFVGDAGGAAVRGILALVGAIVSSILVWLVWSYAVYLVARGSFSANETFVQVLRPIGFAQAPRIFGIFSFIPIIGALISIVVFFWSLFAGYVAVKEALGLTTMQAIITIVIAFIIYVILTICIGLLLAPFGLAAGVALG